MLRFGEDFRRKSVQYVGLKPLKRNAIESAGNSRKDDWTIELRDADVSHPFRNRDMEDVTLVDSDSLYFSRGCSRVSRVSIVGMKFIARYFLHKNLKRIKFTKNYSKLGQWAIRNWIKNWYYNKLIFIRTTPILSRLYTMKKKYFIPFFVLFHEKVWSSEFFAIFRGA